MLFKYYSNTEILHDKIFMPIFFLFLSLVKTQQNGNSLINQ